VGAGRVPLVQVVGSDGVPEAQRWGHRVMVSKTTPMSCGALPRLTRAEAAERADARTRLAAAAEVLAEDQEAERAATTARKEAERALAAACDRVSALEKALAAAQRELDEAGRIPLVYHHHHGHHRQAQDPTLTGAEREAAWRPLPTGVAPAGRLCRTEHHPVVAGPAEHANGCGRASWDASESIRGHQH